MRILFTTTPLSGHFHPLVPFALALRDAGHEVAVASPAALAGDVSRLGLRHFPAGLDRDLAEVFPQLRPGSGRAPATAQEVFAGLWPRHMVPDLLALAATWPPALIVREALEYGGCLAAEVLGLPHAAVAINAAADFLTPNQLAAPLTALRAAFGLPTDPALAMPDRYLTLRPFPPSFRDPARPIGTTTHHLRPLPGDHTGPEGLPDWVRDLPGSPVVYVGMGTVVNEPAIFRTVITGLRDEALTLIVTVGRDQDPANYGPQPGNVRVERYIPLSLLLPHCDLAVIHGGSGTLTAVLAHGLPVMVVPVTADQPANAARCAALGLGRVVPAAALTPELAREAVLAVLADPACHAAAARIRDEIAALPGLGHGVALLERLVAERHPITAAR